MHEFCTLHRAPKAIESAIKCDAEWHSHELLKPSAISNSKSTATIQIEIRNSNLTADDFLFSLLEGASVLRNGRSLSFFICKIIRIRRQKII